jgi:hypothetical protein
MILAAMISVSMLVTCVDAMFFLWIIYNIPINRFSISEFIAMGCFMSMFVNNACGA